MLFCSALLLSPVLKPFFFKSSPRKVSAHVPNFSSRAFSSSRLVLWALRAQLHFSVCQRFLSVKHGSSSLTSSFPSLVSLTSWPRFLICPMLQSQTLHFYLGLFPVPDPQCFYSCSRLCLTRSVAVCWVAASLHSSFSVSGPVSYPVSVSDTDPVLISARGPILSLRPICFWHSHWFRPQSNN